MKTVPPRVDISSLSNLSQEDGFVCIIGRVLVADRQNGAIRVADTSGSIEIELKEEPWPKAGDWISITGRPRNGRLYGATIHYLTAYRAAESFPSPGSEFYRLRHGSPQRIDTLALRARCQAALRAFFDSRGYLEVQTPLRVRCPGLEPHLRAESAGEGYYLITSPEYHMKRLLAGGLERIYFLGPCWRGDELGHHHLNEFCMLEWYRAFSTIDELMRETEALLSDVVYKLHGTSSLTYQGQHLSFKPPFRRLTVTQAFREYADMDIAGVVEAEELRERAERAGFGPYDAGERFEAIASHILVEKIEPALCQGEPIFLCEFPAPLAALSRLKTSNPSVAERFELYAGGLELANAFGELTDPDEQLHRLEKDQETRRQISAPVYPIDQKFIQALREGMPPASGIALGVDRLLMLLSDATHIRDVVAFAPEEI